MSLTWLADMPAQLPREKRPCTQPLAADLLHLFLLNFPFLRHLGLCVWCSMGVTVRHMWGMTELGPLGSVNVPKGSQLEAGLTQEEALDYKVRGGGALPPAALGIRLLAPVGMPCQQRDLQSPCAYTSRRLQRLSLRCCKIVT